MNRYSWRPADVRNPTRWWLAHRLLPLVLVLAVVGWFVAALVQPFLHPRIFFLFAAAEYGQVELSGAGPPARDRAAVQLPNFQSLGDGVDPAAVAGRWQSPEALDAQLNQLEAQPLRRPDIVLVWLRAQWVLREGEVQLLSSDFDPGDERAGFFPLSHLLDRLGRLPVQTKLLFLDGGRTAHSPRLGLFADTLPRRIRAEVEQRGDPSLWALLSHAPWEYAGDAGDPAQSVFAERVGAGLRGAADRNQDGLIDLAELADYLAAQVARQAADRLDRPRWQTPQLVWGGGPLTPRTPYPLVTPVPPHMLTWNQAALADPATGEERSPAAATEATGADTTDSGQSAEPAAIASANGPELVARARAAFHSLETSHWHPRTRAPYLWRSLDQRLQAWARDVRVAERGESTPAPAALRRKVAQLEGWLAGDVPQTGEPGSLLVELAERLQRAEAGAAPHSLALRQAWAEERGETLPDEWTEAIGAFARAIDQTSAEQLVDWIEELPATWDRYTEIRTARQLVGRTDLGWLRVQQALRTVRIGERAAARAGTLAWTRPLIERGDRQRRAGQQRLLQGVRPEEGEQAHALLAQAQQTYQEALELDVQVSAVQRAVQRLLYESPVWFRKTIRALPAAEDPVREILVDGDWLEELALAIELLDRPAAARLPELRRVRRSLEQLEERFPLDDSLPDQEEPWRVDLPVSLSPDGQVAVLGQIAARYGRWLQILAGDMAGHEPLPRITTIANRMADLAPGSSAFWSGSEDLGEELREFYQQLPVLVSEQVRQYRDLTDPSVRPERLIRLAAAQRLTYRIHPWDAVRVSGPDPAQLLDAARLYDFLVWQQQRLEVALQEVSAGDQDWLAAAADSYRQAAAAIDLQPPLAEPDRPGLQVEVPERLALIEEAEREFTVSVTNRLSRTQEIWLACDYDAEVLELMPGGDGEWLDISSWPEETRVGLGLRGILAELGEQPSSFRLGAGERGQLRLRVRRRIAAGHPAQMLFRVAGSSGVVRQTSRVDVPGSPAWELQVDGLGESWQTSEEELTLYAFPNRSTNWRFSLINRGTTDRQVDFVLVPAPQARWRAPPSGEVAAEVADRYMSDVRAGPPIWEQRELQVPADSQAVPVRLAPVTAEGSTEPEASPTQLAPTMLIVITDRETERATLRRVVILAQRPGRYVEPRVEYDPRQERVEMVIRPLVPLPAEGVSIVCLPPPSPDGQIRGRASGLLLPGSDALRLHVQVPPDAGPVFPLTVEVDEFARAFRFLVPTTAVVRTPVPRSHAIRLRIVDPPAGAHFGPGNSPIPVQLQADIPEALMQDGSRPLEIGIDTNRDRTLQGEATVTISSDREVEFLVDPEAEEGRMGIATRVRDPQIPLPRPKLRAGRANVLACVVLPERVVWSDPVEIVFDDQPPQISQVRLVPGRRVVEGEQLELSLLATDGELSGIAGVQAAWDVERRGEFTPESETVPGAEQADGRWLIRLPSDGVPPGVYNVLVRATDRAGNPSGYERVRVELVDSASAAAQASGTRLIGQVVFGRLAKKPAAGISVQLTSEAQPRREQITDPEGRFAFDDVPPGQYELVATGQIAGNRRDARVPLEISDPPQTREPVELVLQSN